LQGIARLATKAKAIRFGIGRKREPPGEEWFLTGEAEPYVAVLHYALTAFSADVTAFLAMGGVDYLAFGCKKRPNGVACYEAALVAMKIIGAPDPSTSCDQDSFATDRNEVDNVVRKAMFLSGCLDALVNTHNQIIRAKSEERQVGATLQKAQSDPVLNRHASGDTKDSLQSSIWDLSSTEEDHICPKISVEPLASPGKFFWTAEDELPVMLCQNSLSDEEDLVTLSSDGEILESLESDSEDEWDCSKEPKEIFPFDDTASVALGGSDQTTWG